MAIQRTCVFIWQKWLYKLVSWDYLNFQIHCKYNWHKDLDYLIFYSVIRPSQKLFFLKLAKFMYLIFFFFWSIMVIHTRTRHSYFSPECVLLHFYPVSPVKHSQDRSKERLKELDLFSLADQGLSKGLINAYKYLKRGC